MVECVLQKEKLRLAPHFTQAVERAVQFCGEMQEFCREASLAGANGRYWMKGEQGNKKGKKGKRQRFLSVLSFLPFLLPRKLLNELQVARTKFILILPLPFH